MKVFNLVVKEYFYDSKSHIYQPIVTAARYIGMAVGVVVLGKRTRFITAAEAVWEQSQRFVTVHETTG